MSDSAPASWAQGPLLGFDTETTGVSVTTDRIVTTALIEHDGGEIRQSTWLIDPGVDIPAAASAIHGVTNERARAEGAAPPQALEEIATALADAFAANTPVVAFNAAFDLSILETELRRHRLSTLSERLGHDPAPVIDPLVLDRAVDPYRRGKRTLTDLCRHYGISDADLHTAEVDVTATLEVLRAIVRDDPRLGTMSLHDLHRWQAEQHRLWAEDFNRWRAGRGMSGPGASVHWPLAQD